MSANAGPGPSSSVRPTSCSERRREQRGRRAAAGGAAPSRGRASRRRPCARAGRPRRSGGRRASPGTRRGRGRRAPRAPSRQARDARARRRGTRGTRASSSAVAPHRRRERRRVDVGRLERPHVELQPVAELLDAAEHAHGVALGEAPVEQLDVVPDARLDAARRVDELEREVRRAGLRAQLALRPHRVDALDDPVLCELGDRHGSSLRPGPDAEARPSSRPSAISSSTAAASLRRQPKGAAEVGRGQLAGLREHEPGQLAARIGARQAASPAAATCARAGRVRSRPTGRPARRGGRRQDELRGAATRSPCRRPSSSRRSASRSSRAGQRARRRAIAVDDLASRPSGAASARGRRASAGAAARRRPTTRARCLPTQASPAAGSSSFAPQRNAIASLQRTKPPSGSRIAQFCSGLPLTCSQSDGRTTSAFGKSEREADLVDPRCCLRPACAPRPTRLQECRRSGPFRALRYDPAGRGPARRARRAAVRRHLRRRSGSSTWRAARTTSSI